MTEKQASAEAMEAAAAVEILHGDYDWRTRLRGKIAIALDAFAARSRHDAIAECADVCRSLGQSSGVNVQPAIEQIADLIAKLDPNAARSQWRPIETHNDDGAMISVFVGKPGYLERAFIGSSGRWKDAHGSDLTWRPTHWQPLPSPPEPPQ